MKLNPFHPTWELGCPAAGGSRHCALTLPALSFSERVLVPRPERLVVVRVKGVEWSDWGHPRRVLAAVHRAGWQPGWLERVRLAPAG